MIKVAVERDFQTNEESTNVTWVSKRYVKSTNSNNYTGLSFYKATPRVKDSILKSYSDENSEY